VIVDQAEAPVHVRIAEKAKHLRELGMSDKAIARVLGVSDKTVGKAVRLRDRAQTAAAITDTPL